MTGIKKAVLIKEDETPIWEDDLVLVHPEIDTFLAERVIGTLQKKGFWLSPHYDWEIVTDPLDGALVLIPQKK